MQPSKKKVCKAWRGFLNFRDGSHTEDTSKEDLRVTARKNRKKTSLNSRQELSLKEHRVQKGKNMEKDQPQLGPQGNFSKKSRHKSR